MLDDVRRQLSYHDTHTRRGLEYMLGVCTVYGAAHGVAYWSVVLTLLDAFAESAQGEDRQWAASWLETAQEELKACHKACHKGEKT